MNKLKNKFVKLVKLVTLVVAVLFAGGATVHAVVPAEIDAIATDATSLFGDVTTIAVSIVAFGILLFVIRKIRGR